MQNDHGLPAGAAERPEPAAGRPGPVDQGDLRPDRVRGRSGPGRRPEQADAGQDSPGRRPTSIRRKRPWRPSSTTRAASGASPGRSTFAIDGKDETAWGIDVGPGRRNQPRKAVFIAEKPIAVPGRHDAHVPPGAEARRLEQRRQPEQQPRPLPPVGHRRARTPWPTRCPHSVRDILAIPREQADARRRTRPSSATGGRPSPSGRRPTTGSRRCGGSIPRERRSWCLQAREQPRADARAASAATSSSRASRSSPGVPAFLHPLPPDAPPTRLTFARWLVDRKSPTTARALVNRVWQAYFGTGLVAPARTSAAERAAVASRAARLAGRRVHGARLEPQEAAPADRRPRRPIANRRG